MVTTLKPCMNMPDYIKVAIATFNVETHDGLTATVRVSVDLEAIAHTIGGKAIRSSKGTTRAIQGAVRVTASNVKKNGVEQ
jgi:hypothetical protein